MQARPHSTLILLIAVAMIAGVLPAAASGASAADLLQESCMADDDPCCDGDTVSPAEGDDCCQSGCDGCFLACCAGMVSVLAPFATGAPTSESGPLTSRYLGDPSLACDEAIDHPPQA